MGSEFDIRVDPKIFNPVYRPHLNNLARTQIFYGGSSSGKSVFLAQRAVFDLLSGGRNYLICRQVARTIKTSVFAQVCREIAGWGVGQLFTINKADYLITCINGYQIAFVGLDDVEKIKSIVPAQGAWTDIWVEEATETERDTIKQLYKRQRGGDPAIPKRLTLSFNPILQTHWIYTDYFAPTAWADSQTEHRDETLSILKTWYIHNQFLTPDDVKDLESETDPYYRSVYTFGNWGVLGHLIFTNWRVEDLTERRPHFINRRHGLDFGFSSDPAAMPVTHYDRAHKTVYVYDELYERGLTNDLLAGEILKLIDRDPVVCDSAEPKSIAELRQHGVNARGARKGKDSVLFGIQWLQQQTVVIDPRCINARNEFQQYHWQEDKDGNPMRQPVDKYNHLIDAMRYAYEDDARGEKRSATSRQG
jgi:phage terminase large subunit